jgi:hypothetical protein
MITNVYGPQSDNLRSDLYNELRLIRMLSDFVMDSVRDFEELLLSEVPLQGRKFTYSKGRLHPTHSKLDRVFMSGQWNMNPLSNFILTFTDLLNITSDHAPLKVSIQTFKFEKFWLKYDDIEQIVQ